jgi:Cu(I)/Ag(I) efflux system membrane protein CusA/SilA
MAETEFMVRASGYLKSLDDFRVRSRSSWVPVAVYRSRSVMSRPSKLGPEMRRVISELDGEGEAVGGVVILRSGKNARETIAAVKDKLEQLKTSLPPGVEIVTTYDRSLLIDRAVTNLSHKLLEEFLVVALVCAVFLWHLRSSLVAIISLPIGILIAFIVMRYQGLNANIMSLGGIAIAIGAMVDAAVVMIENAHKRIEQWHVRHPGQTLQGEQHWKVVTEAAAEVGPALFFCLLIITLSFIPVFTLQAQEGRLFGPLAFTKTYAMAAAAGLSVTLIPVLMGYWIRGHIPSEQQNPLNRWLIRLYQPLLDAVLRRPKVTLAVAALVFVSALWPISRLGGEFLPPLDEGDLLYMPSALPGLSAQKAAQLLQQTDRLIKTVPEVEHVFGKAGRAETATDPAPLEMFETTIRFKPHEQWRPGMTPEKLVQELDRVVQVPGLTNIWIPPIRNRIDMLATGIKSPIGVKVAGASLSADRRGDSGCRARRENCAWRQLGAGRTTHRRPLYRCRYRPQGCCSFWAEYCGCAVHRFWCHRRRKRRRNHRGARTIPDQSALSPRVARLDRCAGAIADLHAAGQPDHFGHSGADQDQRRPADAQKRECAPLGVGVHRCAGSRYRLGSGRLAASGQ